MSVYHVEVEIAVEADSPSDARVRIQNLIGTAFDFTTGTIHDDEGQVVEDD